MWLYAHLPGPRGWLPVSLAEYLVKEEWRIDVRGADFATWISLGVNPCSSGMLKSLLKNYLLSWLLTKFYQLTFTRPTGQVPVSENR